MLRFALASHQPQRPSDEALAREVDKAKVPRPPPRSLQGAATPSLPPPQAYPLGRYHQRPHPQEWLLELVIDKSDPLRSLFMSCPLLALSLLSQNCTNWWCGMMAITVAKLLGGYFESRADALLDGKHFITWSRALTNGVIAPPSTHSAMHVVPHRPTFLYCAQIMQSFKNKVSHQHGELSSEDPTACAKMEQALTGLRTQGALHTQRALSLSCGVMSALASLDRPHHTQRVHLPDRGGGHQESAQAVQPRGAAARRPQTFRAHQMVRHLFALP